MDKIKNIHNCHILRGLAASMVVIYHAKFIIWSGGQRYLHDKGLHDAGSYLFFFLDMLSSCGKQCVVIFFILSAFFIQYSFQLNQYSFKEFFKIRLIRIYYPYLLSLVFSIAVLYVSVRFINPALMEVHGREYNDRLRIAFDQLGSVPDILKSLVFIKNQEYPGFNFAYWSLLHEGIFYLLFPVYLFIARSGKWLTGALAMTVLLAVILKRDVIYYQVFFIVGLLLYNNLQFVLQRLKKIQPFLFALIVVFFVVMNLALKFKYGEYMADIIAVIITILTMGGLILYKKTPFSFFVKLGEISYSLYLFHLPLLLLQYALITKMSGLGFYYNRIYYIIAIVAIAVMFPLFKITEKPSLLYLKRMKRKAMPDRKTSTDLFEKTPTTS